MKKFFKGLMIALLITVFSAGMVYAQETVDVYHWWTAGGEEEAINALIDAFEEAHPNITVRQNPIAGGGGANMRAEIKSMVAAGNPPNSWQLNYGYGMISSFAPALEPISHIWEDYPVSEDIKQWGTIDGEQYAIPINVHRTNSLWYNVEILEEVGIETPIETIDEFMDAMAEIKEAGYTPLAVGHGAGEEFRWCLVFDSLLAGVPSGDYQTVRDYHSGELNVLESEAYREALTLLAEIIESGYINDDFTALTWDEGAGLVAAGDAAFNIMGDWVKGYFTAADLEPNVDFGFMPVPGTSDLYIGHGDSFVAGELNEATEKWFRFLTSKEAQTAFNPIKGSTPPRVDAPLGDNYGEIMTEIIKDFRDEDVVKVQSYQVAPPEETLDIFGRLFSEFVQHLDVDLMIQDIQSEYDMIFN